MITEFQLRDFKGHRDTRLRLGRFTMLVGDNASGKTSVLEALRLLGKSGRNPTSAVLDYFPSDVLRRGATGPIELIARGETTDGQRTYTDLQIQKELVPSDSLKWTASLSGDIGGLPLHGSSGGEVGQGWSQGDWPKISTTVGTAELYSLDPGQVAAAAYSVTQPTVVERDGKNTAVVLVEMVVEMRTGSGDDAFARVESALKKLVPVVERVRVRPALVPHISNDAVESVKGWKINFDYRGGINAIPAEHASHGTLILLALLTILHSANRPNLILLDDLERGLHPLAQMELVRLLKGLLQQDDFADIQIVATTHSPYILDELDVDDIYAFTVRDDGTVVSKPLSAHPEAQKTKGALSPGQLWSLDSEREWVLRDSQEHEAAKG